MLLPVGALWIAVFIEKVDIPLTCDVSVPQKQMFKLEVIARPRLNRTAMASLAPVADRARYSKHLYMFENEGRKWSLLTRNGRSGRKLFRAVPPEIFSVIAGVFELGANTGPHLFVEFSPCCFRSD